MDDGAFRLVRPASSQAAIPAALATSSDAAQALTATNDEADRTAANGDVFRHFTGSKAGAGVWQSILNQIPPHDVFIEAFAGTAAVTRHKRPATTSTIVIDSHAAVCEQLKVSLGAGVTVICADAVAWLEKNRGRFDRRTVIYCDPPYLFETRDGGRRKRYGHEFGEEYLHGELLAVLSRIACLGIPCLISGYRHELYDRMLPHWRRLEYRCSTRGGPRTECLWCNFDEPTELHEYTHAGSNFRERERLKRKKVRWLAKLDTMPALDRAAVLAAIDEWRRRSSSSDARGSS